jgi:hypothetical protein
MKKLPPAIKLQHLSFASDQSSQLEKVQSIAALHRLRSPLMSGMQTYTQLKKLIAEMHITFIEQKLLDHKIELHDMGEVHSLNALLISPLCYSHE